ncbi:hypothetical protein Aple_056980 [Acrocarpospora pleiomorpha]|uniref:Uncharacterized protein n=1 Tax=Acrocarpospora pleiomorpha TaxID=90975 RepID=A0A5M3XS67_9ACTN|nr:hypothetical protein Aple_056980 [Acrocarpospora pleiomorpha]
MLLEETTDGLDFLHIGHLHVRDHHVGFSARGLLKGLDAGPDDFDLVHGFQSTTETGIELTDLGGLAFQFDALSLHALLAPTRTPSRSVLVLIPVPEVLATATERRWRRAPGGALDRRQSGFYQGIYLAYTGLSDARSEPPRLRSGGRAKRKRAWFN